MATKKKDDAPKHLWHSALEIEIFKEAPPASTDPRVKIVHVGAFAIPYPPKTIPGNAMVKKLAIQDAETGNWLNFTAPLSNELAHALDRLEPEEWYFARLTRVEIPLK